MLLDVLFSALTLHTAAQCKMTRAGYLFGLLAVQRTQTTLLPHYRLHCVRSTLHGAETCFVQSQTALLYSIQLYSIADCFIVNNSILQILGLTATPAIAPSMVSLTVLSCVYITIDIPKPLPCLLFSPPCPAPMAWLDPAAEIMCDLSWEKALQAPC